YKQTPEKVIQKDLLVDYNEVDKSIKYWQFTDDRILSNLCKRFPSPSLFRTTFLDNKPTDDLRKRVHYKTQKKLKEQGMPSDNDAIDYFYSFDVSYSEAYRYKNEGIWILENDGEAVEFSKAAD